ncbi:hypothetical protein AB0K92_01490 [Streptomyces sp. NPDC052687]|uniref:hypothetical protein n=1 Tax=Streptomyces sp. NPDC052687 TaxID=3154759 RepID=UPI00343933CB
MAEPPEPLDASWPADPSEPSGLSEPADPSDQSEPADPSEAAKFRGPAGLAKLCGPVSGWELPVAGRQWVRGTARTAARARGPRRRAAAIAGKRLEHE